MKILKIIIINGMRAVLIAGGAISINYGVTDIDSIQFFHDIVKSPEKLTALTTGLTSITAAISTLIKDQEFKKTLGLLGKILLPIINGFAGNFDKAENDIKKNTW